MFFHFSQNNSGGSFDYDEPAGITHHVVIEADSLEEANQRAEAIGLYWDGVGAGKDCECCGDRWSPAWSGDEVPAVYGKPVTESEDGLFHWMPGYEVFIHYKDGRIEGFHPAEGEQ